MGGTRNCAEDDAHRGRAAVSLFQHETPCLSNHADVTDDFLRLLGDKLGLITRPGVSIDKVAERIAFALDYFALHERRVPATQRRAEMKQTAIAMQKWAEAGMKLVGNGYVSESAVCRETLIRIMLHSAQRCPEAAASLAAKVGKPAASGDDWQDEGVRTAFRLLPEILNTLAGGSTLLLKELNQNPIRKPADLGKRYLVADLKKHFEQLYTARFTISTRHGSARYGVALSWCRAIFAHVAAQAEQSALPDHVPEFRALQQWAMRSDALPAVIRSINRMRKATKGK